MSLKDRLKRAWTGFQASPPVEMRQAGPHIRATTIPAGSPQAAEIMRALASGDMAGLAKAVGGAKEVAIEAHAPGVLQEAAKVALGGDSDANALKWATWRKEAAILTKDAPGWSPCRFYNRVGPDEGRGVFGVVKGDWGIWRSPYDICGDDFEDSMILPALTYLPEGLAMGLLLDTPTAVAAAEIVRTLDWSQMPEANEIEANRDAWAARNQLVKKTLAFHGIAPDPERHAHESYGGTALSIYARAEEPEKRPGKKELM